MRVTAHQRILRNLARLLDGHVRAAGLGEVLFAPLQPDLAYIATDRADRVSARGIEGAPTLAVEVLSPSTATVDRTRKPALYRLVTRASGGGAFRLPPLAGLEVVPDSIWP